MRLIRPIKLSLQILFIWYWFISISLSAQSFSGKVVGSENSIKVFNVQIINASKKVAATTNEIGVFTLTKSGSYVFSKKGYYPRTIIIKNSSFIIIKLEEKPENLNEILIKTGSFQNQLKNIASSISLISTKEISSNSSINISPILNLVSGVYMQSGTQNTNRITIRGIGSRNLYGTSKIRAYYQDIPLTNGSGESTIEDIELNSIGQVEISKGPSSSLYGAGLGGTIQLIPNKGTFDEISLNIGSVFGAYGLKKYILNTSLGNLTNSANIIYTNTNSDGYRENNSLKKQVFTVASNHFIQDTDKLTLISNFIDLKAYIPSSLNEDDYLNNPKTAAYTWGKSKGYEDYKKGLFGLAWQHDFNLRTKQITSVFTSFLKSYEARPFNILKEKANAIGLRTKILSENKLLNKSLKWTIGGEFFYDRNFYQTFENLYKEYPPEEGSVQGEILSNFKENRVYFNLFFDSKYVISDKTIFSMGLNFNQTSYKLVDKFYDDKTDFSGNYRFDIIISPKIGIVHQINPKSMIYGTISHGFSPPKLEETLLPNGLINTDIKPETGWNYEIGSRGNIWNNIFNYSIAIYRMDVKDLLVARRTSDNQFIGVNAGKTKLNSIEIDVNYNIIKSKNINITHSNSFSLNDFKFKEFEVLENDYSGNDLTGTPKNTFNSQINFDSSFGFYGYLNYYYVGRVPLRDDNSIYSQNYQLINSKMGYKHSINNSLQINLFIGINNLFNEKYASMLLINASSFGNKPPRYYYPGEPVNYYSGINLKYLF